MNDASGEARNMIADAISSSWGERARAAAIKFAAAADLDEEPAIVLLQHLLLIFEARGAAVLASQVLVEALIDHEDLWGEWRGARGDERPRKFTQGDLALLLRPFRIRSRKIWITRDPPKHSTKASPWRHRTPLGIPVVPPV